MTRINTNVSSLTAQKTLARSNAQLQQALTRLSTGLRINAGKDDPAGLIASEVLRSDIVSTERAITNSERANQMIGTADSALGQVNALLNDIRGLISEAANTGAMSDEQLDANQLQVDSSLEAIDRIAQITQFQGKRLLDGNMDFITSGVSSSQITDLQIDQANFGTLSQISVSVDVVSQAEKAQLQYASNTVTDTDGVTLEVGGTNGFEAFSFAYGSSVSSMASAINLVSDALGVEAVVSRVQATADGTGQLTAASYGDNNDVVITAENAGRTAGDIAVKFVKGSAGSSLSVAYTNNASGTDTVVVTLATSAWTASSAAALDLSGAGDTVDLAADMPGTEFDGVQLVIDSISATTASAYYDYVQKEIHISLAAGANNVSDAVTLINNANFPSVSSLFTATANAGGAVVAVAGTYGPLAGGSDGDVLASSATLVAAEITANAAGYADAAVKTGDSGAGTVQPFEYYSYYGSQNLGLSTDTNDYLQFLAPNSASNVPIRFVNDGASQSLSVTLEEKLGFTGKSKLVYQDTAANASFQIEAKNTGTDWDGVSLQVTTVAAAAQEYVVYNPSTKRINVGLYTGGATHTAQHVVDLINNDPIVSGDFSASVLGAGTDTVALTGLYSETSTGGSPAYNAMVVHLATDANGTVTTTANDLVTYANTGSNPFTDLGISVANAYGSTGAGLLAVTSSDLTFATNGQTLTNDYAQGTTYNRGGDNARMLVKARTAGAAYDDVRIEFADTLTAGAAADVTYSYNSTDKTLTIGIASGTTTLAQALARFTAANYGTEYSLFDISAVNSTTGVLYSTDFGTLSGGVSNTGSTNGAALLGNVDEGDYIGDDGLIFRSTEYGSKAFVSVKSIQGTFAVTDADGTTADRDTGADIQLRINGIEAVGDGLKATINTSTLDMSMYVASTVAADTTIEFTIDSGGAQFQLGPDVVSNQQARFGIQSISTAQLGGPSGRLFQLRSGGPYDVKTDPLGASQIVEEVINQVTTLRGRLGAFQRTTLESNINTLNDTLESLTDAESSIRDADFAAESASLTRAQILVQSGVSVLSIANSTPQNVLALLR